MISYIPFFSGTATVAGAIGQSWELLGLEGGGPLDLLARRLGTRQPRAGAPARLAAPDPGPGRE